MGAGRVWFGLQQGSIRQTAAAGLTASRGLYVPKTLLHIRLEGALGPVPPPVSGTTHVDGAIRNRPPKIHTAPLVPISPLRGAAGMWLEQRHKTKVGGKKKVWPRARSEKASSMPTARRYYHRAEGVKDEKEIPRLTRPIIQTRMTATQNPLPQPSQEYSNKAPKKTGCNKRCVDAGGVE